MIAAMKCEEPTIDVRCELAHAAGVEEPCPGPACPLWDTADGCVLGGLRSDFGSNPDLVYLLLGMRDQFHADHGHAVPLPGLEG
jgi:hypothetical protein